MTAPSAGSTAAAVGRDGADGDRIQLRGIRATGIHGVLPEERVRPQPFEVDLDLWVDLATAGASDRLDDTVDYAGIADVAIGVVVRVDLLPAARGGGRLDRGGDAGP